ncbi:MAG: uracil-DNA glycosylase family protein [Acidimicrobiales bacterium]
MAVATGVTAAAAGLPHIDLGCGAGRCMPRPGSPTIGFDRSQAALDGCRSALPRGHPVRGDIGALPFAAQVLGGARLWIPHRLVPALLPMVLWDLHRVLRVGAPLGLCFTTPWTCRHLVDVAVGAGFEVDERLVVSGNEVRLSAVRSRTLADTVGPGMRLLVCGSNPSLHSADAGVGYFRAGNRFWKAALAAGIVSRDRDPVHALDAHGIGMTDQVKRASRAAGEVSPEEYRRGFERVERLVRWLQPNAVCLVGLGGWRAVAGSRAHAGLQDATLGGRPLYVMPSTSGLNARTSAHELSEHLRAALALGERTRVDPQRAGGAGGS